MDKQIKKKLKIVLIAFAILIIPLGYLIAITFSIKIHDDALEKAMIRYPDDNCVIKESINQIDKAIKIYPWNYLFRMNKAQLQMKLHDFSGALISAKKGTDLKKQYAEGLEYIGLIYEFLNQSDSARIYYSKAIDKYKERLDKNKDNYFTSRQIALLYTFINQKDLAQDYLTDLPESIDFNMISMIKQYDYYIENYKTGGLKDYLHGETIIMINDSITEIYKIDSLVSIYRIYYNGYNTFNNGEDYIFEFRKIFKDKAQLIGFKEIDEKFTQPNMRYSQ